MNDLHKNNRQATSLETILLNSEDMCIIKQEAQLSLE